MALLYELDEVRPHQELDETIDEIVRLIEPSHIDDDDDERSLVMVQNDVVERLEKVDEVDDERDDILIELLEAPVLGNEVLDEPVIILVVVELEVDDDIAVLDEVEVYVDDEIDETDYVQHFFDELYSVWLDDDDDDDICIDDVDAIDDEMVPICNELRQLLTEADEVEVEVITVHLEPERRE